MCYAVSIADGTQFFPRQDINLCTVLNQLQFKALDRIVNHGSFVPIGNKLHVAHEYKNTSTECTLCSTKIKRPNISYVPLRQRREVRLPS
jgi:hypothetical protein